MDRASEETVLGLFIRNRALRRLECFTVKAPRQVWTARVNGWGLNGEGLWPANEECILEFVVREPVEVLGGEV